MVTKIEELLMEAKTTSSLNRNLLEELCRIIYLSWDYETSPFRSTHTEEKVKAIISILSMISFTFSSEGRAD